MSFFIKNVLLSVGFSSLELYDPIKLRVMLNRFDVEQTTSSEQQSLQNATHYKPILPSFAQKHQVTMKRFSQLEARVAAQYICFSV